jgi:UDP-glucose 4-epimerase
MNLENQSILVTGGAGFIGSHLVDRLIREKPANLVVVDDYSLGKEANLKEARAGFPGLKVYNLDAADVGKLAPVYEHENIDVVFNLADVPLLVSFSNPRWVYEHNISLALSQCELVRRGYFKTLIHFSSADVYGSSVYTPMDEKHPLNPTTPYGASKAAGDALVLSYINMFHVDAVILRLFNNVGPRQNAGEYAGIIPLTVKRVLSGEPPVIHGDGEQTRDYIYVTETAEAAVAAYNQELTRGQVVNIGSGSEVSVNNLVSKLVGYLYYSQGIIRDIERPGDIRRLVAGTSLARRLWGFSPGIGLDEGLKPTVQWYQDRWKVMGTG